MRWQLCARSVAKFKVRPQNVSGGTEENYDIPPSGYPKFRLRFEHGSLLLGSRSDIQSNYRPHGFVFPRHIQEFLDFLLMKKNVDLRKN
jgi:hypothetical protein